MRFFVPIFYVMIERLREGRGAAVHGQAVHGDTAHGAIHPVPAE